MRPRPASVAARAWRRGLLAWIGWTLAAWLAIVWAGLLIYVMALLALRVDHYSAQDRRLMARTEGSIARLGLAAPAVTGFMVYRRYRARSAEPAAETEAEMQATGRRAQGGERAR